MKKRKIELAIQVFDSFEEAERSEKEFWWKLECPLIGGCAAFYHGYPRATEGIDLALKT